MTHRSRLDRLPVLSLRKWEVVAEIALGRDYRQIGAKLGISWRTVADHVRTIAARLPPGEGPPLTRVLLYARELLAIRIEFESRDPP